MNKRFLHRFFKREQIEQKEAINENPVPTQEEINAVDVIVSNYTAKNSIPLLPREEDVWVICGKGIGLRGETVRKIRNGLSLQGYSIQYYEQVFGGLTKEALEYNFPDLDLDPGLFSYDNFIKAIREGLGLEIPERSILFIKYDGKTEAGPSGHESKDRFCVFDATAPNAYEFLTKALAYIQSLNDDDEYEISFSITADNKSSDKLLLFREAREELPLDTTPAPADKLFDEEMEKVAIDTYLGLRHLVLSGYSIDVIEGWLNKLSKRSRVVITEDYRIMLPDYQNKEVEMDHLPKALYFFFLKHDRAYAIYQMMDQKKEIMKIYQKLTNSNDLETIEERIDSLVDPKGVSFVEKCSRIRKAFDGKVPKRFVEDYYIQGPQGEAKRIKLDRNLVEWRVTI